MTRRAPDTSGAKVYKVKKGDMLSKIAYANGLSSKELAEYNSIPNPNAIRVGQKILIPPYAKPRKASTSASTHAQPAPVQQQHHAPAAVAETTRSSAVTA